MLTGNPPFQGENLLSISRAIAESDPVRCRKPADGDPIAESSVLVQHWDQELVERLPLN